MWKHQTEPDPIFRTVRQHRRRDGASNDDGTPESAESLAEENRRLRRENASLCEDRAS
jgi:transposase-like protein